jgi:hypothetical protein
MILIAHRGNLNSKSVSFENHPEYVDLAIKQDFDVEIDLWYEDGLFLGHDAPKFKIKKDWISERRDKLWIHCKNIKAIEWFNDKKNFNYFWHQEDVLTLTSKGYIWVYPDKQPVGGSIAVLPELYLPNIDVSKCIGICSDVIKNFIK